MHMLIGLCLCVCDVYCLCERWENGAPSPLVVLMLPEISISSINESERERECVPKGRDREHELCRASRRVLIAILYRQTGQNSLTLLLWWPSTHYDGARFR